MLTMPHEARWQSYCIAAMGVTTIALGLLWVRSGRHRGVAAAVVATLAAQVVPDFVGIPRLISRRTLEMGGDVTVAMGSTGS